ncbi:aldehyde dehydrogenase family protein [Phytoactinopolyspora halotolerans]|uniref:Aldehyde dehydrogenase n=1 Tax=Phytoactinopolyspora halotolerans TaxID=1981512 RepID=A0A6L9SB37_9ACTN|nr:aldehyde dehydrogenase family protein [Phytoactinopolyspora halotolerans]NEE02263.1 aldehyde dehydrogenase family protein [Phytoactinopolyspora halotolerans]
MADVEERDGDDDGAGAVSRLRDAFDDGVTRPLPWRADQLRAVARMLTEGSTLLERALYEDLGKPAAEAQVTEIRVAVAEATHALRHLRRWMRPRRRRLPPVLWPARGWVVREPLGVVLIISPWNYPVQLSLVPLVGAVASGNAVVLKPSELAPATSSAVAGLVRRFMDPRAVAVVEGGPEAASHLLEERFDHIFFTGSTRTARIVAESAAKRLTPVTLELGGKSPVWVDRTVRLQPAADRIAWGKFVNAGQTCVAPDYVLATPDVADALIPALGRSIRRFFGDDAAISPDYGRILNHGHHDRLVGLLDGASVVIGGRHDRASRYLEPTVVDDVTTADALMSEEIFGPILPIVRVPDAGAAIEVVRSGPKPLTLYVFSDDRDVLRAFAHRTSSGALGVNVPLAHLAAPELPFGGVGASGTGRYHGEDSIRTFSHERAILSKPLVPDTVRMVYPPYGRLADFVARRLMR